MNLEPKNTTSSRPKRNPAFFIAAIGTALLITLNKQKNTMGDGYVQTGSGTMAYSPPQADITFLKQQIYSLEKNRHDEYMHMKLEGKSSSATLDSLKEALILAESTLEDLDPGYASQPSANSSTQPAPSPEETARRKKEFEYQIQELQCLSKTSP